MRKATPKNKSVLDKKKWSPTIRCCPKCGGTLCVNPQISGVLNCFNCKQAWAITFLDKVKKK